MPLSNKKKKKQGYDLLLVQIGLMHETYFGVAKTRAGKGEPRGYCRALKDIEVMVRDMKDSGVAG